jgi:DNA-binding MurR/RpiR family transcriptional regulator
VADNQTELASGTVASRIRASLDELTAKERQVARVILAQYPAAGLETTAALSSLANVSGPTVVRLVARLGYGSYRDFQSDLRQEISAKTASPITRMAEVGAEGSMAAFRAGATETFANSLTETLQSVPDSELEHSIELLADTDLTLHLVGGRYTRILADYLCTHLQVMRENVRFYSDAYALSAVIPELRRRDCVVIYDFRRYQADIIAVAKLVRAKKARMLLITDPWMSPIAELADVVLTARVDAVSPFDSHVASLAITEVLIGGVNRRLAGKSTARIKAIEEIDRALETHL